MKYARELGSMRRYADAISALEPCRFMAERSPVSTQVGMSRAARAGAYLGLFEYPAALAELVESRRVLTLIGDWDGLAVTASNLSNLYFAINAIPESLQTAETALTALNVNKFGRNISSRDRVLMHKARLLSRQGRAAESEDLFAKVIDTAERETDDQRAAEAWDLLGFERLNRGDAQQAERAMLRALRIRWTLGDRGLGHTRRKMALIRLARRDLASASQFSARAIAAQGRNPFAPDWNFLSIRGRIFGKLGEHRQALDDLRSAAGMVDKFRLDQIPMALRSSSAKTVKEVYDDIVSVGTRLYKETSNPELLGETLAAVAASQAFSLQVAGRSAPTNPVLLARFGRAYAASAAGQPNTDLSRLRLEVLEAEVEGAATHRRSAPKRLWGKSLGSLERWQSALADDEAVLAVHLGESESHLWAFTRGFVQMLPLPARDHLDPPVRRFRRAVEKGEDFREPAKTLHDVLFSGLDPRVTAKSRWLVVADGPLFQIPFAALVTDSAKPRFLVEDHSIRLLPGLWMIGNERDDLWDGPMVGVADAVYNRADSRLMPRLFAGDEMPRLPATASEVARCAKLLGGGGQILTGSLATLERLHEALQKQPRVVHFAAHAVAAPDNSEETLLLLSPSPGGAPGYLGPEWVASQNARPVLVTMSSCRSGSGQVRVGDGLMGLTRAWLLAGAHAVLATHWPTPDDSHGLTEDFYRHWRALPLGRQDEALRQAQLDAIRSASWRSEPGYWASYFVIGDYSRISNRVQLTPNGGDLIP